MGAAWIGLRLVAAMAAGIPIGSMGWLLWQGVRHPWLGHVLLAHPLLAFGMVTGGGAIASLAWGAAMLAGIDVLREAGLLHGWIIASACVVYLWRDNPFGTER